MDKGLKRRKKAIGIVAGAALLIGAWILAVPAQAAERAPVRVASEGGNNGFGIYLPFELIVPGMVKSLPNKTEESAGAGITGYTGPSLDQVTSLYVPDLLIGYKFPISGGSIEPVAGLSFINGANGSKTTTIGFAGGAKYFYTFLSGPKGNVYAGGTGLIQYLSKTTTVGSVDVFSTAFGLDVIADIGFEIRPFDSLPKLGFTFDAGLPLLGILSSEAGVKSGGVTSSGKFSGFNFLESSVVISAGMHIYF